MSASVQLILWVVALVIGAGLAYLAWAEVKAYLLKTTVSQLPGGLRFGARNWSAELRRATQDIVVQASQGRCTQTPLGGGPATVIDGALSMALPALGLRMQIVRSEMEGAGGNESSTPFAIGTVVFYASDEMALSAQGKSGGQSYELVLPPMPDKVIKGFMPFAAQVRLWVERHEDEHQLRQIEQAERAQAAKEAAMNSVQTDAEQADPNSEPSAEAPPDPQALANAQISKWRKAAGFAGTFSEVGYSRPGKIEWFVDLTPQGRITLHANGRTVHTTLLGATVRSRDGEVEVSVRDDYWSEEDNALSSFRVLKGVSPEALKEWANRLESLRDQLNANALGANAQQKL